MQIGFVNFNTEEKKRVAKMMHLLQESEAIEELGIGRVRDHFSNTLFPGTSTLQHHAKYFVLLSSLYYHAAFKSRRFKDLDDVFSYIKKAEVQITRQLSEDAKTDIKGITGIKTYKDALDDYNKFVKYDPAYIYGGGLVRYGIIPNTAVEKLIFDLNKTHFADPHNKSVMKCEDLTEDAGDLSGDEQFIKTCGESYDFFNGKTMSLSLTPAESSFMKDRIKATCSGSMLDYLIECKCDTSVIGYFDLEKLLTGLNSKMLEVYKKSVLFSKLIHLIDWRYNYCYFYSFGKTDKADSCNYEYLKLFYEYKLVINNKKEYEALFKDMYTIDISLAGFCEKCYIAIIEKNVKELDRLVREREYTVKKDRKKIGNNAYRDQERGNPKPNTFRWENVRTMVSEIRNPQ